MGVKYCSVYGCLNNSKQKNLSFYGLPPKNSERLKKWLNLIGREDLTDKKPASHRVCSVHFEDKMFINKRLGPDAVPSLHLPGHSESINSPGSNVLRKNKEYQVDFTEPMQLNKVEPYVSACRACLATDCRLYDVTKYGLQEAFDKLAGAPFSAFNGLRHLCQFCSSELSKYAAFRDRCQRVHELLATLQECGAVKMDDIRAIDRDSHKLTRNLNQNGVEIIDTTETVDTKEAIDTKEIEIFLSIPLKAEEDYTESVDTNFEEINEESVDSVEIISNEVEEIKDTEMKEVIKQEKKPTAVRKRKSLGSSEVSAKVTKIDTGNTEDIEKHEKKPTAVRKRNSLGRSEVSAKVTKIDTGNTEDIEKQEKKPTAVKKRKPLGSSKVSTKSTKINSGNLKKRNRPEYKKNVKVGDDFYPDFDYKAFENEFKVKIERLSKDEQRAELEARKLTDNYLKSPHRCDFCGKGFTYLDTLKNHMSYHDHSNGPFECEICHYRFATRSLHAKHRPKHRLKITCQECGFVTRGRALARQHFEMHSGKTYACPHCAKVFARVASCANHARLAHPGLNVACDQCGETFLSANGVRIHKQKAHRENTKQQDFKCSTCDVNFASLEALDKHTSTALDCHAVAVTPCKECGENCESAAALSEHTALRHPPDQYRCHECDATFSSAASFETHHSRKHLGVRRSQAPHPYRARGGRGRGRGGRPPLRDTREGRVVCEICGKIVQSEIALKAHRWHHLKPFKCTQCPKAFAHKHMRDWHMNTHTGEKPYQCEACPAAFAGQCSLIRHRTVVHLNKRPSFPCPLCDKTLASRANVKLHVNSVHNNMPWPKRKRRKKGEDKE